MAKWQNGKMGRFRRVWEGSVEFGMVWGGLSQNCVSVIENSWSEEFRGIWADLEMPKVYNCYQIHHELKRPKGQPKAAKRCPKMTTWIAYGRQMAAEAELLQHIFSKNFLENVKRHNRC